MRVSIRSHLHSNRLDTGSPVGVTGERYHLQI